MQENSDQIVFAQTKIQPPRARSGLIARAALEGRLCDALASRRLTLLQAPAGWGKTSALTRALSLLPTGHAFLWITADEADDPQRLLACLSAALGPLELAWRVAPQALPALAERGLRQAVDEVANALATAEVERGIIVIDDMHRVRDPRALELLRLLLESMPVPHWGMVLSTRTVPDLPMARWRVRNELTEFRLEDLRFEEGDIAAMLAAGGVTSGNAAELALRTEGWAAGLSLFLSVGGRGEEGLASAVSQRHVFEYLADEVLSAVDEELREFLLRCSILPELTPSRCAHLAGQPRAALLLERIERDGLFVIRLDAEERTLRLHDLFRDFLEDRLQRDHASEMPALLRRAAEQEPDLARAVGWLARAGAWDEAAGVLAERGPLIVPLGGGPTIERLLALFPEAERQRRPELHHLRASCAYQQFDFEVLYREMKQAAEGYERDGQREQALLARVYAAVGMRNTGRQEESRASYRRLSAESLTGAPAVVSAYFQAWEAHADRQLDEMAPAFARALQGLEQTDDSRLWEACFLHCFLTGLPGMAPLLRRFDDSATRLTRDTPSVLRGGVLHSRATVAWGEGKLPEALELLAAADETLRWLGSPHALADENYLLHMLLDGLRGDEQAVELHTQRMRTHMRETGEAHYRTHMGTELLAEARAWWLLGDHARVRALEQEIAQARNPFEWSYAETEHLMAQGMVALGQGHDAEAAGLLNAALWESADEDTLFFRNSQTRIMLAEAHRRLGALDAAAVALRPWLQSVHGGGFVGGALMAGPGILESLAGANWGGRLTLADLSVLRRLHDILGQLRAQGSGTPLRTGGLTEREWQVLERIAAGDSNKLIARALDLSLHTVKRHVANIFDKLALSSRTQAAVWVREQLK